MRAGAYEIPCLPISHTLGGSLLRRDVLLQHARGGIAKQLGGREGTAHPTSVGRGLPGQPVGPAMLGPRAAGGEEWGWRWAGPPWPAGTGCSGGRSWWVVLGAPRPCSSEGGDASHLPLASQAAMAAPQLPTANLHNPRTLPHGCPSSSPRWPLRPHSHHASPLTVTIHLSTWLPLMSPPQSHPSSSPRVAPHTTWLLVLTPHLPPQQPLTPHGHHTSPLMATPHPSSWLLPLTSHGHPSSLLMISPHGCRPSHPMATPHFPS